jgi:hypothetical protein
MVRIRFPPGQSHTNSIIATRSYNLTRVINIMGPGPLIGLCH